MLFLYNQITDCSSQTFMNFSVHTCQINQNFIVFYSNKEQLLQKYVHPIKQQIYFYRLNLS